MWSEVWHAADSSAEIVKFYTAQCAAADQDGLRQPQVWTISEGLKFYPVEEI